MKNLFCVIFLTLGSIALCTAQNLDQYKYVQIPESFDFQKEANQHQLNALAAFLFEREGFEVLYKEVIPKGLDGCDMLKAKVDKEPGLFTTRLILTLENCQGAKVFTSKTGSSREKDYTKAYQEALRDAFTSLEELEYSFRESAYDNASAETRIKETTPPEEGVAEKLNAEKAVPAVIPENRKEVSTTFRNGSIQYTLKKTASGFSMFKGQDQEEFASLLKTGGGSGFLFNSKKMQGTAYFDGEGNLLVDYFDPNMEQLVTVKYQAQD